jgi:hypothetical protein
MVGQSSRGPGKSMTLRTEPHGNSPAHVERLRLLRCRNFGAPKECRGEGPHAARLDKVGA